MSLADFLRRRNNDKDASNTKATHIALTKDGDSSGDSSMAINTEQTRKQYENVDTFLKIMNHLFLSK